MSTIRIKIQETKKFAEGANLKLSELQYTIVVLL